MNLETAVRNFENHGFIVRVFRTAQEAAEAVSQELSGKTIGIGGSMTIETMGLCEMLKKNNTVYWHWRQGLPAHEARRRAALAQVYLSSANALSETGEIVNIDGTGNRVGATFFGHEALYIIAGTNKLAPDLPAAMERARNVAAPLNARRLKTKTPCALVEPMRCHDCNSPDRICRGFSVFARPPHGNDATHLILIEEPLGY